MLIVTSFIAAHFGLKWVKSSGFLVRMQPLGLGGQPASVKHLGQLVLNRNWIPERARCGQLMGSPILVMCKAAAGWG